MIDISEKIFYNNKKRGGMKWIIKILQIVL